MSIRVRFAPSPTGALHIGGVRTALYNYLFAKKNKGTFILRIEDTDQTRFVPGAENYIIEALKWTGIIPDEGVEFGGEFGPYRQSDRKAIYSEYAHKLVERGHAYYAFDTAEELETLRQQTDNFTYNQHTRYHLKNSLTQPKEAIQSYLDNKFPYVIRLKVEPNEQIQINDLIRGTVTFHSAEIDDKVLLKADGMPTYHLANVIDDHLMKITHVIRGEEWLPSTAHHVLLYQGFGWTTTMPAFAHLPLIMKPAGNGKLSKRDGAKFGIPVFPLDWNGDSMDDKFPGFRETGFLPEAVINFLALLGWHPGGDRDLFHLEDLINLFSIENISKGGARFDYEKARWFNQKYIQTLDNETLATLITPHAAKIGYSTESDYLKKVAALMKDRVYLIPDFVHQGYYLFEKVKQYDSETIIHKWNPNLESAFAQLIDLISSQNPFESKTLEQSVKNFVQENKLKMGDVMPLLRIAFAGTMKGPAVFDMAEVLGKEETVARLKIFLHTFKG